MQKETENRIVRDYNNWYEKEQRFEKIFNTSLLSNKAFMKEKLEFLSFLPLRYKESLNEDERIATKILQSEKVKLEKLLYPNRFFRLIHKIQSRFKAQNEINRQQYSRQHNFFSLQKSISNMGFGDVSRQLRDGMRQGSDKFVIPVYHYFNNSDSVNFELIAEKDLDGFYKVEKFKASLINPDFPGGKREQIFSVYDGVTLSPARTYNLLSGRAVHSYQNYSGSSTVSLDFNDKDQLGNFRMKFHNDDYTASLKDMLDQLPVEIKDNIQIEKLKEAFSNGDRVESKYKMDGIEKKFYMEANHKIGRIDFYDQSLTKTDYNSIFYSNKQTEYKAETLTAKTHTVKNAKKSRNAIGH